MANIFDLPPEILGGILSMLPGQALQSLRASCRGLNQAASPLLFPVLYLSCHPLDLDVFQLVAANELLLGGVRELVIDDTTLAPSLSEWKVFKAAASTEEVLWPDRRKPYFPGDAPFDIPGRRWAPAPDPTLHELFMSVFKLHHHNRRTHADLTALKDALPRMNGLHSLVLTNRTADEAPASGAQSQDSSSPTVRMWRRFGTERKERPPFPPRCDWWAAWGSPIPRTYENMLTLDWLDDELERNIRQSGPPYGNEVGEEENQQVLYWEGLVSHGEVVPGEYLHFPEVRSIAREARGLLVALTALESPGIRSQLREFRVDASHDIIQENCQPGLPIRLFDSVSPFPDRLAAQLGLASNLTSLHLSINDECMPWERDDVIEGGHFGLVLASMPQLEQLVFEAHGMSTVAAIPDDLRFTRLRHVKFSCGHIDPEKLASFIRHHATTLEILRIEYCSIHPHRDEYTWHDVMRGVSELQEKGTTNLREATLFSVFGFKPFSGCGKNGTIRVGRRQNQVYSWTYGVDATLNTPLV
ncbi:hypothetical protein BKA56DRAFT_736982 [Ilyonectria sp. MPI-CAGE-AT-0026]|nr:hypothetical protein BKA56DRAFT_736982 [Ilyonectria sp. MPI-CAGE-AT-0026]